MRDDGIKYEDYCCTYLQEKGYSTQTTVASGDQGADIIAEKDGIKIAVQCKYRTEGSVGNDAVQQALAGKIYYDCDLALVITNVDFTTQAQSAAKKLKVKLWPKVKMINGTALNAPQAAADDISVVRSRETIPYLISGAANLFSVLDDRIALGKTLINQRFIPNYDYTKLAFDTNELRLKDYEKNYLDGKMQGLSLLETIQSVIPRFRPDASKQHASLFRSSKPIETITFDLVDWCYSAKRDKSVFIFETKTQINYIFTEKLQAELNEVLGVKVAVVVLTPNTMAVSIVNRDNSKSGAPLGIVEFIANYINQHVARSVISTDSNEPLTSCKSIDNYCFEDNDEKVSDYGWFYSFTCKEPLSEPLFKELIENATTSTYRKLKFIRKDSHNFVLCIRKLIGLDDNLELIDVRNFNGNDLSDLIDITTGISSDNLEFTVKIKNIDLNKYDGIIKTYKNFITVKSYIEQIRFYVMGLFDQVMIKQIKSKKIDIPLYIIGKRYWSEGLEVKDIHIKAVDKNNRIIFLESTYNKDSNVRTFPILCMKHESFCGSSEALCSHVIGINTMMLQKLFLDRPELTEIMGGYYVADTLKEKVSNYLSTIDHYLNVFVSACENMSIGRIDDDRIIGNLDSIKSNLFDILESDEDPEDYVTYCYNIRSDEKELFYENEYDDSYLSHQNTYFWNISAGVLTRDLVWGTPNIHEDNNAVVVRKVIEEYCLNHKIALKHRNIDYPNNNYFYYKLSSKIELSSVLEGINAALSAKKLKYPGYVYAYLKEYNECVFVWHKIYFGKNWFSAVYRPMLNMDAHNRTEIVSHWNIGQQLYESCTFESYNLEVAGANLSRLDIKLNSVQIRELELDMSENSAYLNIVWGAWNDFIYSLLSLSSFSQKNSKSKSMIIVRDSNDIIIAIIPGSYVLYSYLQFNDTHLDLANDFNYGYVCGIDHMKFKLWIDDYRREIVPIINETMLKSIKTLEELTQEHITV